MRIAKRKFHDFNNILVSFLLWYYIRHSQLKEKVFCFLQHCRDFWSTMKGRHSVVSIMAARRVTGHRSWLTIFLSTLYALWVPKLWDSTLSFWLSSPWLASHFWKHSHRHVQRWDLPISSTRLDPIKLTN